MFYPRNIYPKLQDELKTREIVVITGMRQVGKTTILQHLFDTTESQNKVFLDAGNPLHRKAFEEQNYDNVIYNLQKFGLISRENAYVFVDEIQNMTEIPKVIKYLYDHYKIKCIVTGSSSYYLKNLFSESLAGRKVVYEMFPLTFSEFLMFQGVHKESKVLISEKEKERNKITPDMYSGYLDEYIEYGGFPGIVVEKDISRKKILLDNIFRAYFEIDVKNLADFKELSKLRDLILLLVPRVGSKLDITKLASELEVSRETIYSYLSFLEQTYFISMIPKFSKSFDRKSAGSKKLYYCDSGLANHLGRLSEGQLFENIVFQNLRQSNDDICYFSKKSGAEIDFIINSKCAVEVKLSVDTKDVVNTKRIASELGLKESYIVSKKFLDTNGVILAHDL